MSHCDEKIIEESLCVSFNFENQEKIVGVPFCVSKIFWYRNNLWIRGVGGVSRFSVRNVLSHSAAKTSLGMFQCFTVSGIEKTYALEG